MFSSIASFIFGSNTSASATATTQQPNSEQAAASNELSQVDHGSSLQPEENNTIQVTSLTPSVTGSSTSASVYRGGKRAKNKRQRQQAKRQQQQQQQPKKTPSITKLLTPSAGGDDSSDEPNCDDDDWFIVEKEEEHDEEESLPRTDDSEEDVPVVEVAAKAKAPSCEPAVLPPTYAVVAASANARHPSASNAASRRRPHLTSHSLYGGPRPQQPQRHHHQHLHQRMQRPNGNAVSLALLASPPRGNSPIDGGVTQSLYVASHDGAEGFGAGVSSMEESWFVTPPPCFTSIGPIHMETSPFENLLIEHPSMSVYHSIRSAQEATESFVNLDLGVEESQQAANVAANVSAAESRATGGSAATTVNNGPVAQRRAAAGARIDRFSAAQLKQELMARNTQKNREEKDRQNLCRSAIKRANKVRDYQGKGNRQRRSDLQHSKVVSGANNNRKCCY